MEINKISKYYFILLTIIISSCKKEEALSYLNRPVVEAYLIPGHEVLVKVYYQKDLNDTSTYGAALGGLSLSLSDGSSTVALNEDSLGYYRLHNTSFISAGKKYYLSFKYNEKEVSAETTVPLKPKQFVAAASEVIVPEFTPGETSSTFNSVKLSWENPDNTNYLIWFQNQDSNPSPVNSRFNFDDGDYDAEINAGAVSFYSIQQMTFRYLGLYKAILVNVNSEYIDMLESNGTSSQNLTNPPTNVKNGLGIFTAMNTDTLNITVRKD